MKENEPRNWTSALARHALKQIERKVIMDPKVFEALDAQATKESDILLIHQIDEMVDNLEDLYREENSSEFNESLLAAVYYLKKVRKSC